MKKEVRSVSPAQVSFQEILSVVRRRKKLLILPAVLVTGLSVAGAFLLPKKYESSTTILVQKDEVLNPLISYEMAVAMASDDRLRTFNEIIYSQTTIQVLIDSLRLGEDVETETEQQELIKEVRKRIETTRPGAESFRISYMDSDPVRAQRGAAVLANHFMTTILGVENQRNELAVRFFTNKLEEYRKKFEESQETLIPVMRQRVEETPVTNLALQTQVEDLDAQKLTLEEQIEEYQHGLTLLRQFPTALRTAKGKQTVFDLGRLKLPYVEDLRAVLVKYDEYINLRKYTSSYPEVAKLESQILALTKRMREAIQDEMPRQQRLRSELDIRRGQLVSNLKQSTVAQHVDQEKVSSSDIYRDLYEEMKVKLEQARTTYDLGKRGENQFIILDPPVVPRKPAKPNKALISLSGLALGLMLGILCTVTAELRDTTIRSPKDLAVYNKPIVAYISDRRSA
jgi:uncharacterized protein involved in exopolysaccharide biosynthesis